jgi:four helix bundle protein
MGKVQTFEDLEVWKDAIKIGVKIYRLTSKGTLSKDFSTKDQLRRAAVSISNNIAEGFEYNNNGSFIRFLKYAKGSAGELRSNLLILKEVDVINEDDYTELNNDLLKVARSIEALVRYLKDFESKKIK